MATVRPRKTAVFTRHNRQSLYVRIFIPAELRSLLGRSEIWKSLDTSDQGIAELRAKIVARKTSALFLHISQHGQSMTLAQIRGLVSRYIGERLDEWEESIASCDLNNKVNGEWQDGLSMFAQSTVEDCSKALRENDPQALSPETLKEFLSRYDITGVLEGSQTYRLVSRELLKAESVIAAKIKERVQGDYGSCYEAATVHDYGKEYNHGNGEADRNGPASSIAALLPPSTAGGPLLSACIPYYLKHFEHRAPGTLEAKRNMLKRFLELTTDKPLGSIGKQDCITYRDTARRLPSNASKKFPGLSLKEVLERAKGLPTSELLSKQTINQDLTHLGHFFSWLINEGRTTWSNPVDGLAYEGIESKSHEAFSDADIKLVFGSSEFRKQKADKKYSSRFWLPLILLHTGARREEIANLALADIRQEEGIHFFDVTPDLERGRRLKNKSSKRRVPIHSHLISSGFLDYVESRRSKGESLVFSKMTQRVGGRETVGDSVSKWFHRLLKRVGVNGKKSLHGLRATVNTKLHEAGCDGEVRRELLGRSGKDINETVYLRLSLKTLSEGLEMLGSNMPMCIELPEKVQLG